MARVLIATDDSALFEIFAAECGGEGHDTLWAINGHEAFQAILDQGPDLVFLDLKLAIFSGLELSEMLRTDPQVPEMLPVFLLTDDEVSPNALKRARATGIFPKTHATSELRELLSEHLIHIDRLALARAALQIRA